MISTTELRRNLRKYLVLANNERVIIRRRKTEMYEIIPAGKMSDTEHYFSNPKVREHLKKSIEQAKTGKTHILKKEEINSFLGLE
jgi:hypothetical protein